MEVSGVDFCSARLAFVRVSMDAYVDVAGEAELMAKKAGTNPRAGGA